MTQSAARVRRVALISHPARDNRWIVGLLTSWAEQVGTELVSLTTGSEGECAICSPTASESLRPSDLVIAAGGDGTILHALAVAAPSGAPVLGVNLGHLGFLAEIEPHELGSALTAIAEGHFHVEDRLALTAQIESSGETRSVWAANDLVMTRAAGNGQADLALGLGGEVFARLAGDGLIVSTPTGSTAYNLSAGGPIVSPAAKALVLTPLANHGMFNRSIVTDAQERVDVRVLNGSAPLTIEHDGVRCWEVGAGAKLSIAKSETSARLVRLGQASFYERARSRLQLADPLELVATNADGATPTLPRRA